MAADVERLKTGQAPAGIPVSPTGAAKPVAPSPGPAPKAPVPAAGGITIPAAGAGAPVVGGGGGMGKKLMLGAVVLVVVLLLVYFVSFLFGGGEPTPTATPTAEPTVAPTLRPSAVKNLDSYFGLPSGTLSYTGSGEPLEDEITILRRKMDELMPVGGQGRSALFVGSGGTESALASGVNVLNTFAAFGGPLTAELVTDSAAIVFSQTELFDAGTGQLQSNAPAQARLVIVQEITDATAVNQLMLDYETELPESSKVGMAKDLAPLFNYRTDDALVGGFMEATYRQLNVRYWNFPYADRSIDWAIVPASNGKNYLVISGSRQSMFFAIDQLLK